MTGAGSGIGEGAAIALAREGATVVLTGRRKEALEEVAGRIANERRQGASSKHATSRRPQPCRRWPRASKPSIGRLDIVVNNAGMNIPDRSWQRLDMEGSNAVIQGNLTSAFYVVQAALPIMRAQGGGLFIHTASWAGRFIGPVSGPAYTAAKHGMVAMSHTINLEEGRNGIRSSVVLAPARWRRPSWSTGRSRRRPRRWRA